jgi:hypothetical protein
MNLAQPLNQQIPGFLICIGQGQPVHSAARGSSDLGQFFNRRFQALTVDSEIFEVHESAPLGIENESVN